MLGGRPPPWLLQPEPELLRVPVSVPVELELELELELVQVAQPLVPQRPALVLTLRELLPE